MAFTGKRALLVIALLGLLGLADVLLWAARHAPEPVEASGTGEASAAEQAAAQARWEALWQTLAEQGVTALAPGVADASLQPAGDTAFMRYRQNWREVDAALQRRLQLVALANDPARKLELLAPLLTADVARLRYRALLEQARIHLRSRDLPAARLAAQAALAVSDIPPLWQADAYFMLGFTALEAQDLEQAATALAAAVARDPGFWDARQTDLLVLTRLLEQPNQSSAACLDRTRRVIEHLGALPALAQNRAQFRDIADRLGEIGGRNPALKLAAGLGRLWAGDTVQAAEWLHEAATIPGALPAACADLIRARAALLAGSTR